MKNITIENRFLKVEISPIGAELQRIFHKQHELEYLWNGDPAFWAKRSPVLFPIVGTLKNDTYFYEGKPYHLGRHGFARESLFTVVSEQAHSVTFSLHQNESTLKNYPFAFRFYIEYALDDDKLSVSYIVVNPAATDLYFSVGGHPAFRVPLATDTSYTDYTLEFDKKETLARWPISANGLIETTPVPLLDNTRLLPLTKELFLKDALVFKSPESSVITLRSDKTVHGFHFDRHEFPYLGIWAAKGADFVCIEPWCGIADSTNSDQQLIHKEGIEKLSGGAHVTRKWSAVFF